jgi:Transposase domain (DUF772)
MRIIPERLDYLWFLGYGLDDEIPDHSVLSKARSVGVKSFSYRSLAEWSTSAWRPGWSVEARSTWMLAWWMPTRL